MAIARLSLERRYALLRLLELTAALGRFGVELLRRTHARTHTVCTRAHQESAKSRRLALLRRQSGATTISGAMSHERRDRPLPQCFYAWIGGVALAPTCFSACCAASF
jgi:hypothetical protein